MLRRLARLLGGGEFRRVGWRWTDQERGPRVTPRSWIRTLTAEREWINKILSFKKKINGTGAKLDQGVE